MTTLVSQEDPAAAILDSEGLFLVERAVAVTEIPTPARGANV